MSVPAALVSPEVDLDVGPVLLDVAGKKFDARLDGAIVDGELERTLDGAPTLTLTVHDPGMVLLRSGTFSHVADVRLDRQWWRLAKVSKSGDDLTLTFEAREVALLRKHNEPKKAARATMTRAEFALSLVREVKPKIPFVCPELHVTQAIENKRQAPSLVPGERQAAKKGIGSAKLTVKGKAADQAQRKLGERMLDVAVSVGLTASSKATLALVEAVIVESLIRNLAGGDADSRGILQVRDVTAKPMRLDNRDPEACALAFLQRGFTGAGGAIEISRTKPRLTAGQVAQLVQGSAYGSRYDEVQAEALAWVSAYHGTAVPDPTVQLTKLPYQFRRGGADGSREDSWTCLQRLATEVQWRCFAAGGSVYFVSDEDLLKAKPRVAISEHSPGVDAIDFDLDTGKRLDTAIVTAHAARWFAGPGTVCELVDCGPADGRWLIASIRRGLFDATATITLRRQIPSLPEPAPETRLTTRAQATLGSPTSFSGVTAVDRMYAAARAMHKKRFPYVWGGGHAHVGVPDRGTGRDPGIGYDCSGSTCALLAAGGFGFKPGQSAQVSGYLASKWGADGKGDLFTVYANDVHVFVVFHTRGGDEHFGTGDWGKGWGGPGFNPNMHPTAGFQARHWPEPVSRTLRAGPVAPGRTTAGPF